jgi:hypothetical protein
MLKLATRNPTDFSPETKRRLAEAKKTNFGKPVKPAVLSNRAETLREAKARLLDTVPSKREQRLVDFHLGRAAELEKAGNGVEAAFYRQQAETVRRNGVAIREVFAGHVAKHEKEIAANLSKPLGVLRAERKAKEAATTKKMRALAGKQKAKGAE